MGIRQVTSETNLHPTAISAKQDILEISMELQAKRHNYNTEVRTLAIDVDGKILLPSNTLSVDAYNTSKHYVQRGEFLYDVTNTTFVFTESVVVKITLLLDFVALPFSVANLIRRRASLERYSNSEGDVAKVRMLQEAHDNALVMYEQEIISSSDINALNSPSASKMLNRMQGVSRTNPVYPGG